MASDLFKCDAQFRELVSLASRRTGTDLERICLRGPDRELRDTRNLQPLLVCVSLGYLQHLTNSGVHASLVLGHSLGEISALAAAGIVTFQDAVSIAAERGELMAAAAAEAPGAMAAVLSTERERILQLLSREFPGAQLVVANDNAPNQLVLSGEVSVLERALPLIAAAKLGQCRRLAVAGPWHCPLMSSARRGFAAWLDGVEFRKPRLPVWFNVTAAPESDPKRIRDLIARNLVEPVCWREAMARLRNVGDLSFFEVGPGRVLSGLARANGFGDAVRIHSVNNLRGVELARRIG